MGKNDTTRGAAVARRLRLSAWVDPVVFMNGTVKDITLPNGTVQKDVFVPDVKNLLKKDAFVKDALDGGKTVLDDISLLQTIIDDDKPGLGIQFDTAVLQGAASGPPAAPGQLPAASQFRKDFFNGVIKHCHEVLGVQCLVGFARVHLESHLVAHPDGTQTRVEPQLARWFKMATPVPTIDSVCNRIIDFCEEHLPEFDGISFDLEGLAGAPALLPVAKANMTAFYTTLARKLSSPAFPADPTPAERPHFKDPGFSRLVAFAGGNLIGAVANPDGTNDGTMKSSRRLKHEGGPDTPLQRDPANPDDFVSATAPLTAGFAEQAQDYGAFLTDGRNLLVRTMSYDNFIRTDPVSVLDDWHADIVRYMDSLRVDATIDGKPTKLQLGAFQLGCKTIDGGGQKDRDLLPSEVGKVPRGLLTPDGKKKLGMDGVMGGVGATEEKRIAHVEARCTNLLHPHRIGLALFPTSARFWKRANAALNPGVPEAGKLVGHPQQCPLSSEAIARLVKKTP